MMNNTNMLATNAALAVLDGIQVTPTSLVNYQSRGKTLVIGDEAALNHCRLWSNASDLTLILNDPASSKPTSSETMQVKSGQIKVAGYLGAFNIELLDQTGILKTVHGDILLDLGLEPINSVQLLPPGYLHVQIDSDNSSEIKAEVDSLTGTFEKPKYFNYDPSICAHHANGKVACTRCIDACPAGAIESIIESIQVNPNLCQGGGSCATACPSGAIQYAFPTLADTSRRVQKALEAYTSANGEKAIVLFHSDAYEPKTAMQLHSNVLPIQVEELASVGSEIYLSALTYGASQIVLMAETEIPTISYDSLAEQVSWVRVILTELGMDPNQVSLQMEHEPIQILTTDLTIAISEMSVPNDKRKAFYQSLDHLVTQLNQKEVVAELPANSAYGEVIVDSKNCTLCMACVGACPSNALQDGTNRELPELFFIESNCIQCGICSDTCPEDAVTLSPRIIFDRETRNRSRALNTDTPFACIDCGKPFAPTSVIQKMQAKLKDHYMFNTPRALDRLKKCEDCRVVDVVQDPNAKNVNLDPLN